MPGPPPELRRLASPERQSAVLGERANSAAARDARECGVLRRTGANRSSAGSGAVWTPATTMSGTARLILHCASYADSAIGAVGYGEPCIVARPHWERRGLSDGTPETDAIADAAARQPRGDRGPGSGLHTGTHEAQGDPLAAVELNGRVVRRAACRCDRMHRVLQRLPSSRPKCGRSGSRCCGPSWRTPVARVIRRLKARPDDWDFGMAEVRKQVGARHI